MERQTFDQYLKHLEELKIAAPIPSPNLVKAINDVSDKLIAVTPPLGFEIKPSWYMFRGKSISYQRNILMYPFDFVGFCSTHSEGIPEIIACLDTLKKTMHEFIDMKCPKYLS